MARTLMVASRFAVRQPRVIIGVSGLVALIFAHLLVVLVSGLA